MYLDEKKPGEVQSPAKLEPWRQMLLNAAKDLEQNGWCQRVLHNRKDEKCILGALGLAWVYMSRDDGMPLGQSHYRWAECSLTAAMGEPVPLWNDQPGRTKDEVLEMLRTVATR